MNQVFVELVFMMVILKLPIVYLCAVIWWAVRAEPRPLEGSARLVKPLPPDCPWHRGRPLSHRPRGGLPARRAAPARRGVRA